MIRYILWTSFVFFLCTSTLVGQTKQYKDSAQKFGLVLSGGGAKGFAHIGLIKVLEEIGLRPDYITGASMGSVVGGLYALGLTASELEKIATNQNWDQVFTNQINLKQISIIEKDEYRNQLLTFELKDGAIALPRGLIEGQQLSILLSRLICASHFVDNFDEFPIPFKCVAVNILDGEIVVLESGNLAKALRASMSIPSIFTPVIKDGKLLVDGGVIRNLPVQEVIDMGAEIVLGSNVGSGDLKLDEVENAIDILVQASFLSSIKDSKEQAELCDLVIDLSKGYTAADFDKVKEIIAQGEAIAREHIDALKGLADHINSFPPKEAIAPLASLDSLVINHVDVSKVPEELKTLVLSSIDIKVNNKYSINEVEDGINYAFGTQYFKKVGYGLSSDSTGTTMEVDVKPVAKTQLKFGLHYSNADDVAAIIKADIRNLVNGVSSIFVQGRISQSPAANGHYKKYFGKRSRFLYKVGGQYQLNNQNFSLLEGDLIQEFNRQKYGVYGEINYIPNNNNLFGVKYQFNRWELDPNQELVFNLDQLTSKAQAIGFYCNWNTFDTNFFPTSGQSFNFSANYTFQVNTDLDTEDQIPIQFESLKQNESYFKTHIFFSNYSRVAPAIVLFQHLGLGLTSDPVIFDNFVLGGDFFTANQAIPFVGLQEYAAPFSTVGTLQLGLRYTFIPNLMAEIKGSVGFGQNTDDSIFSDPESFVGYGVTVAYNSILGPFNITYGRNTLQDDFQLALSFGYRFNY